ncbi:MAG: DUF2007 domain-containing protein [Chloroflexi bacterium]|nr:DUF2007 domain-containing protein [Chloroflexota bacterium]
MLLTTKKGIRKMSERKSERKWVFIKKFYGNVEAEIVRGLFEAQGIEVLLSREGAAQALGVSFGAMGDTQLFVPSDEEEAARQLLRQFESGELE